MLQNEIVHQRSPKRRHPGNHITYLETFAWSCFIKFLNVFGLHRRVQITYEPIFGLPNKYKKTVLRNSTGNNRTKTLMFYENITEVTSKLLQKCDSEMGEGALGRPPGPACFSLWRQKMIPTCSQRRLKDTKMLPKCPQVPPRAANYSKSYNKGTQKCRK